ncbi:acetyltransferase [Vibrio cholerae]|nr:acetyltransferase [Vibrio cholerae]
MVSVVVFEFSVMRCQPLRRALGLFGGQEIGLGYIHITYQLDLCHERRSLG